MTGHSPNCRLIGALALSLVLAGVLAACGERVSMATVGPGPVVPLPPVAQITVPPGQTPVRLAASPTPRVATLIEAIRSVTVTPTPTIDLPPVRSDVTPTPAPNLTGAVEEGRQQYTSFGCIACHGKDLSGGIGPKLSGRTPQDLSDDRIRQQVMQGGVVMPVFNLSEQELQNFIAFIRSQS